MMSIAHDAGSGTADAEPMVRLSITKKPFCCASGNGFGPAKVIDLINLSEVIPKNTGDKRSTTSVNGSTIELASPNWIVAENGANDAVFVLSTISKPTPNTPPLPKLVLVKSRLKAPLQPAQ